MSEKEFIDAVLKYMYDDINAPSYIFDEMELGNVSKINIPLIQSTGKSKIEYVREIGYDSIETTTKYKTDAYGNKTHSTSSRTITIWQKDSGKIEGIASSGYYYEKYKIYDEYITNHKMDKNNYNILSNDDLKDYPLTDEIIEFLKNDTLNKVYNENITYPGNHVKNEEYHGTTILENICCTIVSLYTLSITIRDKNLLFIACSNGDIDIKLFGDYPIDDYEDNLKFNIEVTKERKEATKNERKILKITLLFSIISFILLLILGISLKLLALTIISIIILIIGFIIGLIFNNKIKKISKPYYKKIYEHNKKTFEDKKRIKDEGYKIFLNKNI